MTLLAIVLIGYLPGAVAYRLPWGDRAARAALPADERLFWAATLSVAWTLTVTLALAAAGIYTFSALLAVNAVVSLGPVLAGRRTLGYDTPCPHPGVGAILPALLIALGAWLYFPPSEYVIGGKDPGTYMNEGIQIAQRGQLQIVDPTVAAVPRPTRDLFFPFYGSSSYYSVRFMGFFIRDPEAGTVVGQFPHLFPASIAVGYGLNGLSGARQASGVWAVLAALAVFFAGARLLGRTPSFAAAALLMVNVVTVWFARYPNAEVAMQALAFAALLAFARGFVDGNRFFAAVSGWLLALLLFVRVDASMTLVAVLAAMVLGWLDRRRIGWGFWVALVPGTLLASVYYARLLTGYFALPVAFVRESVPVVPLAVAATAGLAVFWLAARSPRVAPAVRRGIPWAIAVALTALAVYAYFFREAAGRVAWHDAAAFRTFAWYVGPWVLALGVAALFAVMPQRFWRDPALFLTAAAFSVFFFYKIRIVPEHFWMTRRFLPVILPAFLLMAAGCAWWLAAPDGLEAVVRRLASRRRRRGPAAGTVAAAPAGDTPGSLATPRWRSAVSVATMLLVLSGTANGFWKQTSAIRGHVEYAGLIPRLEQLAGRFAENDLVIVESRNASDLHVFALPLAYIYARPVLVLNSPRPDKPAMEAFVADARSRYREVFFLGSGGTDLLTKRIGVEPVGSDRFQVPEYDSPVNAYPAGVKRKEFDYGIYRFVDVSARAREPAIVIGDRDDLHVVRFHAKEKDPQSGRTYRWTRDVSYVSLLNVTTESRRVTLWMADGRRPTKAEPAQVEVSLDDRVLGTASVGGDMRGYEFGIPADLARVAASAEEPARLRLRTNTWSPRKLLGTPDDRDLGVMLSRVEVR